MEDNNKICPLRLIALPPNMRDACFCNRSGCAWWYEGCFGNPSGCALAKITEALTDIKKSVSQDII